MLGGEPHCFPHVSKGSELLAGCEPKLHAAHQQAGGEQRLIIPVDERQEIIHRGQFLVLLARPLGGSLMRCSSSSRDTPASGTWSRRVNARRSSRSISFAPPARSAASAP